jgi:hypothetical protein
MSLPLSIPTVDRILNEELGLPKVCLLDPKTFDSGAKADRATLSLAFFMNSKMLRKILSIGLQQGKSVEVTTMILK